VFDILDMRVRRRIDVRSKTTRACEFVVDLLFEQTHWLLRELVQDAGDLGSAEEGIEARVRVREVLGAAEDALAHGVDLFVGHPRYGRGPGEVMNFLGPFS